MAIAKMDKLALTFRDEHLDLVLQLMQGFQGIHIETGFESSIPPSKKAEIDKEITETEKTLQEINAAHNVLKGRKSMNILSMLKPSEEKKLSIKELVKIVEESDWQGILEEVIQTDRWLQNNRSRRQEVIRLFEELRIWESLECNPLNFAKLERTTAHFGSVHNKHVEGFTETLIRHEESGIAFEKITEQEDRVFFLVVCHNSMKERLNSYINVYSFSIEEYMFDKPQAEAKKQLEEEEARLLEDEKEIDKQIAQQSKYEDVLIFADEYNMNKLLRKKKSLELTYDSGDILINGWVVSDRRKHFKKLLDSNVPKDDYQLILSSVKENEIDKVPIKLTNSKIVTVYERLTEMHSMPRYNEVDPTPVMTVFYLLFFGLMVADVGYGLFVFLIGLLVRKILNVKRSTKSFFSFLYYLSFPIMGWGLVFGSFCGIDLPFGLISATVDIIELTILSIVLGYFHIMAGLVMQVINRWKVKDYFNMLTGGCAWFLSFLGGGIMLAESMNEWISSPAIFMVGVVIAGIGLGTTLIVPAVQYGKRWFIGLGKGLYSLYGATSYLGDFISYTRLMALGVAGGSVAMAFNTILGYLPLPARVSLGVVLAIVLHALNIFLSMLSAYVHGIRLEFIEFFGKFYTGGGKRFQPFKAAERNVVITDSDESI